MSTGSNSPDTDISMPSSKTKEPSRIKSSLQPHSAHTTSPDTENPLDTGPISPDWARDLLDRYTSDLSTLDEQEETVLARLAAIQKLQLLWAKAGRIGEMDRSNKRLKTRTIKVLLEDGRLSKKRRTLSGAMAGLQNVVGMLDEAELVGANRVEA
ncbi:MAG: hypothetical protein GOMPHAMPRED_002897 [Gomphillus americanus]|uniref:Uncharacterized protein n=1 Tax=Gomphillus americanus TaxID=1940652 RepID=A0A8H3EFE6_9LECA|nr:MAG: hypothetical protein GOMPHAMPRED_002897 [Gomphillus americanus]